MWNYFSNSNQIFKFQQKCSISKSPITFIIESERFKHSMIKQKSNTRLKFSSFSWKYTNKRNKILQLVGLYSEVYLRLKDHNLILPYKLFCNLIALYNSIFRSIYSIYNSRFSACTVQFYIVVLVFWLYFVGIKVVCKLCISFHKTKIEQVCECSNHVKVIVAVNCRAGYKFEYYKKTQDSKK